jgi:hypothetical protein
MDSEFLGCWQVPLAETETRPSALVRLRDATNRLPRRQWSNPGKRRYRRSGKSAQKPLVRLRDLSGLGTCFAKLEKSSDEVEDVKDDRLIGLAYERSTSWLRV